LPTAKIFQHEVRHELARLEPVIGGLPPHDPGTPCASIFEGSPVKHLQLKCTETLPGYLIQAIGHVVGREPVGEPRDEVSR